MSSNMNMTSLYAAVAEGRPLTRGEALHLLTLGDLLTVGKLADGI